MKTDDRRQENMVRTPWNLADGRTIYLLSPEAFTDLPDGTHLVCIDGTTSVKGVDKIDTDTRGGRLAYGTLEG